MYNCIIHVHNSITKPPLQATPLLFPAVHHPRYRIFIARL